MRTGTAGVAATPGLSEHTPGRDGHLASWETRTHPEPAPREIDKERED